MTVSKDGEGARNSNPQRTNSIQNPLAAARGGKVILGDLSRMWVWTNAEL